MQGDGAALVLIFIFDDLFHFCEKTITARPAAHAVSGQAGLWLLVSENPFAGVAGRAVLSVAKLRNNKKSYASSRARPPRVLGHKFQAGGP